MKLRRLKFKNGWTLDLHDVRNGEQYFRRWPPGVEIQSFFANLERMPETLFHAEVHKERIKEIGMALEAANRTERA